ncbi:MAG: bifunctional diaminohydroxyphosphoribosylaminopyrimidine deaminase/5-amino-6-(5-phosphoribosylamino)uracil reductase RibD [Actinomycetota bacterium]|nr:bifunctional diaminohydroxyphosphoribosylaminopyrimidine deaminase/5-amino-6-(5-phosphoribosylamino)uracil reductase RibD [Actinomycetota bacterium]
MNQLALDRDRRAMRLAILASREARKIARPNPWVGAVFVGADGRVSSGSTRPPGGDHAEVVAQKRASFDLKGSTLYVTLEPCSHHGKTPPCAEMLIREGVSRVVIASLDPDERVSGMGIKMLRDAGVEVEIGLLSTEVKADLAPYLVHRQLGRPFTFIKIAATMDGYIAASDGTSKWITSGASRQEVSRLRAYSDVIITGAGTVRCDDPSLRAHGFEDQSPRRIVLGNIPDSSRILPATSYQGELAKLMVDLAGAGTVVAMVEAGAKVAKSFLDAGLIDQINLFLAPKFIGGSDGIKIFDGVGAQSIAETFDFEIATSRRWGSDIELILHSKWLANFIGSDGSTDNFE